MGPAPLERPGMSRQSFPFSISSFQRVALVLTLAFGVLHPARGAVATNATDKATLVVVVGAAGEEEFGEAFSNWAAHWRAAGEKGGATTIMIGPWHSAT